MLNWLFGKEKPQERRLRPVGKGIVHIETNDGTKYAIHIEGRWIEIGGSGRWDMDIFDTAEDVYNSRYIRTQNQFVPIDSKHSIPICSIKDIRFESTEPNFMRESS